MPRTRKVAGKDLTRSGQVKLINKYIVRHSGDIYRLPEGKLLVAILQQAVADLIMKQSDSKPGAATAFLRDENNLVYKTTDLTKEEVLSVIRKATGISLEGISLEGVTLDGIYER